MANKKIFPSITTITPGGWREKIKEIDELGIKEASLFPTCLEPGERQELYRELEKTGLNYIPHVHLRAQDFSEEELDYLVSRFKTKVFNIHPRKRVLNFLKNNKKYQDRIYVENVFMEDNFLEVLNYCAGICLDISHWQGHGVMEGLPGYKNFQDLIKPYKIGCNHISAVSDKRERFYDEITGKFFDNYDKHYLHDLSEVDYVKKYKDYLAEIISIELENPLARQLEVKAYLEKILDL